MHDPRPTISTITLPFRRAWWPPLLLGICLLLLAPPQATAAEVNEDAGVPKETMFTLIKKGGVVMIPLGIASIIALALAAERFISLRREKVLPAGFLDGLGEAWHADPTGGLAEDYCNRSGGAVGHVFKAGIEWRDYGYEAVSRAIEDAGSREADRMKRSLRPLAAIATVAPLLGLLGTVYGMIEAFQHTAASGGAAKTADLASGIYEALVSTATGLTLAIPVLLVFQYLSARVDGLIDHIDEVGTGFIVNHARLETPRADAPAEYDPDGVEPVGG
jgi:biopolymer transport protein ExbB